MKHIILLVFATAISSLVHAELPTREVSTVRGYLVDQGLHTRKWKNLYDDLYSASSSYKEFGSGYPLRNNIAYYIRGTKAEANQLKLVLNVNVKKESSKAHAALAETSKVLYQRLTGKELSKEFYSTIVEGAEQSFSKDGYTVELVRKEWPTGKGYELQLIIE